MNCNPEVPVSSSEEAVQSEELESLFVSYRERASALLKDDEAEEIQPPEPDWLLRATESILSVITDESLLARLAPKVRERLLSHAVSGVLWVTILSFSRDTLRQTTNDPEQKIYEPEREVESIGDVTEQAAELRGRVGEVIDGVRADRKRSTVLRSRVFGKRKIVRSKPGWVHEFASILSSISQLGDLMTDSLAAMVPEIEAMHDKLTHARPAPTRPSNEQQWRWSDTARLDQKTHHLVIDAFVSWTKAVAPEVGAVIDRRLAGQRSSPASSQPAMTEQQPEQPPVELGTEGSESTPDAAEVEAGGQETAESQKAAEREETTAKAANE